MKLWGNLAFNPLSALTTATLDVITGEPELRAVCRGDDAGGAGGRPRRSASASPSTSTSASPAAAEVGAHKTSMLQDLERGRPMEIDALLGVVVELAELVGQPGADLPHRAGPAADPGAAGRLLLKSAHCPVVIAEPIVRRPGNCA